MPYIRQDFREDIEWCVDDLVSAIKDKSPENIGREGNLNFAVTSLIDRMYELSYSEINSAVGVLECIKLELYRKIAAKYEDKKCEENGEVYRNRD